MTKTCLEYMGLNNKKNLISQNISTDLKGQVLKKYVLLIFCLENTIFKIILSLHRFLI